MTINSLFSGLSKSINFMLSDFVPVLLWYCISTPSVKNVYFNACGNVYFVKQGSVISKDMLV